MIKNMVNMMILASRLYQKNLKLAKSVKNMLNKNLIIEIYSQDLYFVIDEIS